MYLRQNSNMYQRITAFISSTPPLILLQYTLQFLLLLLLLFTCPSLLWARQYRDHVRNYNAREATTVAASGPTRTVAEIPKAQTITETVTDSRKAMVTDFSGRKRGNGYEFHRRGKRTFKAGDEL